MLPWLPSVSSWSSSGFTSQASSPRMAGKPAPFASRRLRLQNSLLTGRFRSLTLVVLGIIGFFLLRTVLYLLIPSGQAFIKPDNIPRRIWQSWKVDALHLEDRDLVRARTWTRLNPHHRYELLTDDGAQEYVETNFGPDGLNRPDLVATYNALSLNLRIIQSDLLRYMIMYIDGGIWADIDVSANKPIEKFIPRRFNEKDVDMVIGIETDEPDFANHPLLGSKAVSFCQWTFSCKPRLPLMLALIENIMVWLHELAREQGKTVQELHLNFDEVLSGTGPSAFTHAILAHMSKVKGDKVTWDTFHDLIDSKLVGGVLVLPSEAFAAGTGHSRSGNHAGARALVQHHFHASSWTTRHQRFRHPIYGEVELCNWDKECVRLWDENTARFDALPEDEQLRMMEKKRVEITEKAKAQKNG